MKDEGILHPDMARVVAMMGHTDLLGIADAGLPIPLGVQRIDLAFAPGLPAWLDVLHAVLCELQVEAYTVANESRIGCPHFMTALAAALPNAEARWVDHEELKRLSADARAVVRTGEFTPFANVLLQSGADFSTATRRSESSAAGGRVGFSPT